MVATPVWSRPYPFHSRLRTHSWRLVARATVTMAVLRICALLLLFDCQEAFHCCLVVTCINRINMISIECPRSGEWCPGKREFDNRIEINRVQSGEIMWLFPLRSTSITLLISIPGALFIALLNNPNTFIWVRIGHRCWQWSQGTVNMCG